MEVVAAAAQEVDPVEAVVADPVEAVVVDPVEVVVVEVDPVVAEMALDPILLMEHKALIWLVPINRKI